MTQLFTDSFESGLASPWVSATGSYASASASTAAAHTGTHSLFLPLDPTATMKRPVSFPASGMLGTQFFLKPDTSNLFTFKLLSSASATICTVSFNSATRLVSFVVTGGGSGSFTAATFSTWLQFDVLYDTVFGVLRVFCNNGATGSSCTLPSTPTAPAFVAFAETGSPSASVSFFNGAGNSGGIVSGISTISAYSAGSMSATIFSDGAGGGASSYSGSYLTITGPNFVQWAGVPPSGTFYLDIYDGTSSTQPNGAGGYYTTYFYCESSITLTPTSSGSFVDDVTVNDRSTIATTYSVGANNTLATGHVTSGSAPKQVHLTLVAASEVAAPTIVTHRGYALAGATSNTPHATGSAQLHAQRVLTTMGHGVASGSLARSVVGKSALTPIITGSQQMNVTRGALVAINALLDQSQQATFVRSGVASSSGVAGGGEVRILPIPTVAAPHATDFSFTTTHSVGSSTIVTACVATGSAAAVHILTFSATSVGLASGVLGRTIHISDRLAFGDAQPSTAVILPTIQTLMTGNDVMTLTVFEGSS